MGLIVVAEWFSEEAAGRARFFDENTRSWWSPVTGYIFLILRAVGALVFLKNFS